MPITVFQLLKECGLVCHGNVKWGQKISSEKNGFYIVALTNTVDKLICLQTPSFDDNEILHWIDRVKFRGKNIYIDKRIADLEAIKKRLSEFWYPDETVLYIGKAGPKSQCSISKRVNGFYNTPLGFSRPHAGGHWINTLKNLASLHIFYSEYDNDNYVEKEAQLISCFMKHVSENSKARLFDKDRCYPFANKEIHLISLQQKVRKVHGLSNQTVKPSPHHSKVLV